MYFVYTSMKLADGFCTHLYPFILFIFFCRKSDSFHAALCARIETFQGIEVRFIKSVMVLFAILYPARTPGIANDFVRERSTKRLVFFGA